VQSGHQLPRSLNNEANELSTNTTVLLARRSDQVSVQKVRTLGILFIHKNQKGKPGDPLITISVVRNSFEMQTLTNLAKTLFSRASSLIWQFSIDLIRLIHSVIWFIRRLGLSSYFSFGKICRRYNTCTYLCRHSATSETL